MADIRCWVRGRKFAKSIKPAIWDITNLVWGKPERSGTRTMHKGCSQFVDWASKQGEVRITGKQVEGPGAR